MNSVDKIRTFFQSTAIAVEELEQSLAIKARLFFNEDEVLLIRKYTHILYSFHTVDMITDNNHLGNRLLDGLIRNDKFTLAMSYLTVNENDNPFDIIRQKVENWEVKKTWH